MNIKELEYFQDLLEKQNFSAVAKDFNVSQPTITMAIKRLEAELGTTLFMRDPGRNHLTVTMGGEQFAIHVAAILKHLQVAKNQIESINQQKLRFGLPPIISQIYFPKLAALLNQHDLLKQIISVERGSAELINLLDNGSLDLALLGSVTPIDQGKLVAQEFAKSNFKIITSPKSTMANLNQISFKELKNQSFITLNENFVHDKALKQLSHLNHFRPKVVFKSNDPQVVQRMVKNNVGISLLSEAAITENVHSISLTDESQPYFHMSVAYRQDHLLNSFEKQVINWILNLNSTDSLKSL